MEYEKFVGENQNTKRFNKLTDDFFETIDKQFPMVFACSKSQLERNISRSIKHHIHDKFKEMTEEELKQMYIKGFLAGIEYKHTL